MKKTKNQQERLVASVFRGPVTNTKVFKNVTWPELFVTLTGEPSVLSDNEPETKAKGSYFVRGLIDGQPIKKSIMGNRNDGSLQECRLLILDVDKELNGHPLPRPEETAKALEGISHVAVSTATTGRSRIIFNVGTYVQNQTEELTKAAYNLCVSRGLKFVYAGESKTKSQPWFLPQTTDLQKHQACGTLKGIKFTPEMVSEPPEKASKPSEKTSNEHNHTKVFIEALQSGTIHEAAKIYAGWKTKTSSLTIGQVFDEIEALVDTNCSDLEKKDRWHDGERAKLEEWFENNVGKTENDVSVVGLSVDKIMAEFEAKDEDIEKIGKEEWLYPNLIQKNYITIIIAEAGGGKTTFLLREACPHMAKDGSEIYYVDADSPPTDYKEMKAIAARNGFKLILPEFNQGLTIVDFISKLQAMRKAKTDLTGTVFIFDTLKKFADLMSKNEVKEIFTLCRSLNAQGSTIILCAHANKSRDKQGHLIPEGVGDVKNDADTLLFFERDPVLALNGGINVTTVCDMAKGAKVRGQYEPFSFNVGKQREVTILDEPLEVIERGKFNRKDNTTEGEILERAEKLIEDLGDYHQLLKKDVIRAIHETTTAGQRRIQTIITQNSKKKGEDKIRRLTYRSAKHNKKMYGSTRKEITKNRNTVYDYTDANEHSETLKHIRIKKAEWSL